ncbi:MAG: gliding motility-associated protein GldE [Bacteroidales bacterium]|nr:gliding motility-associated protein GldE [Bacteroidales bacterium]
MDPSDPDPYAGILAALTNSVFHGFSAPSLIGLLAILILLVFSALISGSETAFFSLKAIDLKNLRESGQETDKLVLELREKAKHLLATLLIANNLVNVAIVIISTFITFQIFNLNENPVLAFTMQVVIVTSLILLFGEIIPKVIANQRPLSATRMMARPLKNMVTLFKPLSNILVYSTHFLDNRLARKSSDFVMSELSAAIDITSDGSAPSDERQMLKGIATFSEKEVTSIMKSRVNITAIDISSDFQSLLKLILNSGFSRIPVYEDSLDKVMGVLYIKDMIPFLDKEAFDWKQLIRPAFYVPETKKINDLLQEFREKKIHLAIVVDEYGGTSGLLTLEDIIEEIVGEINDEFDKDSEISTYRKLDANTFLFEARTNLIDFCKVAGIDEHYFEDVQGESDTLAGLLLELEGSIPETGRKISCRGFIFEITDADNRRIKQVKATKKPVNE